MEEIVCKTSNYYNLLSTTFGKGVQGNSIVIPMVAWLGGGGVFVTAFGGEATAGDGGAASHMQYKSFWDYRINLGFLDGSMRINGKWVLTENTLGLD